MTTSVKASANPLTTSSSSSSNVDLGPAAAVTFGRTSLEVSQEEATLENSINEDKDVEKKGDQSSKPAVLDIEHQLVTDDPRLWSPSFKWTLVAILSFGALIPTMAANIFFPVINDIKSDLHASQGSIALSLSLYILAQGGFPLLWSPLSEIIGRKVCFLIATTIFSVCQFIIAAATKNVGTLIAFRVIAAGGSSAMLAIAAGTLADLYEPAERGVKVGIYYSCPLLGPALGPIFGGAFGGTGRGAWRLTFYFMGACGGASFISFLFFKETFRTERSLAWQKARLLALEKAAAAEGDEVEEKKKEASWFSWCSKSIGTVWHTLLQKFRHLLPSLKSKDKHIVQGTDKKGELQVAAIFSPPQYLEPSEPVKKIVSAPTPGLDTAKPKNITIGRSMSAWAGSDRRPELMRKTTTSRRSINRVVTNSGREIKFRPAISDVSPLGSAIAVLKQPHNIISISYSGLAFASQYSLSYTATRTFSSAPYNYAPIIIGVILLALGLGGMAGSILGGRLSDRALRIASKRNGGFKAEPEVRIMSVRLPMLLCPVTFVGYAWSAYYKTNIAIPVICLVLLGFSLFWIYSSTLSYLIDSNIGRSSGAVACNSAVRGLFAFIASEVAGPLQDSVGDGALYTGWAILLAFGQVGLLIAGYKGKEWRDSSWKWPRLSFCISGNKT